MLYFLFFVGNREKMEEINHGNLSLAVLIGGLNDEYVRFSAGILAEYEIQSVFCENVYSAVALLAKNGAEKVLVVGKLSELSRENARLFDISRRYGYICCCLADKQVEEEIAVSAGCYLINDESEFEEVFRNLFGGEQVGEVGAEPVEFDSGSTMSTGNREDLVGEFNRFDFAPSRAELDALLGDMD